MQDLLRPFLAWAIPLSVESRRQFCLKAGETMLLA
jgi:hypothetical protein